MNIHFTEDNGSLHIILCIIKHSEILHYIVINTIYLWYHLFITCQENVIKVNLAQMYKGQINCQQLIEQMKSTTALQQADLLHIEQEQDGTQAVQQEQLQNHRERSVTSGVL